MKRSWKWLIGALLILSVAGLVWANLRIAGDQVTAADFKQPKYAPLVKVIPVKTRDLTQRVLAPATLEAAGAREIRAPFGTVRARADEVDVVKVQAGQVMTVKTNAFALERFPGQVTRVAVQSAAPDPRSGAGSPTYEVQGEVKNSDGKLRAGRGPHRDRDPFRGDRGGAGVGPGGGGAGLRPGGQGLQGPDPAGRTGAADAGCGAAHWGG